MFQLRLGRRCDSDLGRIDHVLAGHLGHPVGHGGRGQHGLALPYRGALLGPADKLFDILGEAGVEHLVGLVQDQELHPTQMRRAPVGQIHQPTGTADDHVGSRKAADLASVPHAAEDQGAAQCGVELA